MISSYSPPPAGSPSTEQETRRTIGPIRSRKTERTLPVGTRRYHPYRSKYTEGDDFDADYARTLLRLMDMHALRRVQPGLTIENIVTQMERRSKNAGASPASANAVSATLKCPTCISHGYWAYSGREGPVTPPSVVALRVATLVLAWAYIVQGVFRIYRSRL